jgi:8-amino-3,8-dideoxy-alpha-D-manno-octulosonate transaminase
MSKMSEIETISGAPLAIDGGSPVREYKEKHAYPGASFYGQEELDLVKKVIDSKSPFRFYGPDVQGMVDGFEKESVEKFGVKFGLGVNSGTSALQCALAAFGVGEGDEVMVPAVTFVATSGTVTLTGAKPVFVEIDKSLNIDPSDLENRLTSKTKGIIVVHIYGLAADMDPILDFAKKHNLWVLEDCAQAWGVRYHGKYVGSIGQMGAFSLQMNKILTAGEGGLVTTQDDILFERAWRFHDHGDLRQSSDSQAVVAPFAGGSLRMSELTGAIALAQIRKLDHILDSLRKWSKFIYEKIDGVVSWESRYRPDPNGDAGLILGFFLDDSDHAKQVQEALNAEGLACSYQPYGGPLYLKSQVANQQKASDTEVLMPIYKKGMCPQSEALISRFVFIHLGVNIDIQDAEETAKILKKVSIHLPHKRS